MECRKLLLPSSIHLNMHCFHRFSQSSILLHSLVITRHGDDVGLFTSRGVQGIFRRERHPLHINHRFNPLSIIFVSSAISLTKMFFISPTYTLPSLYSFCHLPTVGG